MSATWPEVTQGHLMPVGKNSELTQWLSDVFPRDSKGDQQIQSHFAEGDGGKLSYQGGVSLASFSMLSSLHSVALIVSIVWPCFLRMAQVQCSKSQVSQPGSGSA